MPRYAVTDNFLRVANRDLEFNRTNFFTQMWYGFKEYTPRSGICTEDLLKFHDKQKQMCVFNTLEEAKVMADVMFQRISDKTLAKGVVGLDSAVIFEFPDLPTSPFASSQELTEQVVKDYAKPKGTIISEGLNGLSLMPFALKHAKIRSYMQDNPRFSYQQIQEQPQAAYYMDAYGSFKKSHLFQVPVLRFVL